MNTYDVAIVGGGIAGSALAAVLSRNGRSVLVIERELRFRDRVRGEGIHPWGVAEATRIGFADVLTAAGAQPLPIWQSYEDRSPKEPFHWEDVSIDGLPEIGVHHPKLQEAAIATAREGGAIILRPAKVTEIRPGECAGITVLVEGRLEAVQARLIVGADGRHSATRRAMESKTLADQPHHRFGGVLVDGLALADNATHEASFPGGRVFVMPQGAGRARAYLVTAADRNLDVMSDHSGSEAIRFLARLYPEGSWDGTTVAGPIAFFSNADEWSESISGSGVVLIGDAAGANDPSVGNGISLVLRDVRILSELLATTEDWQAAIEEFGRQRAAYFEVLRQHAHWLAILVTEEGPESDQRRERVAVAREQDPTAGGFSTIFAKGPDGLVANEAARRIFFGE